MVGRMVGWTKMLKRPPTPAAALGFAGLAPFFGLAVAAWVAGPFWGGVATDGLLLYGAVILSFMGGCRWGFAAAGMGAGPTWEPLATSVLPALWGWAAVWARPPLSDAAAAALLALGFAVLFWSDARATRAGGAPAWWRDLRAPLTTGACAALLTLSI